MTTRTLWILGLTALASLASNPLRGGGTAVVELGELPGAVLDDEFSRSIFFAVLQGLYEDGVATETVDRILVGDPVTGYPANFVYSCPICMPAYDAFNLYRTRPPFLGRKIERDTFGSGLPRETLAELESPFLDVRQGAIRELVEDWMRRHLDRLRLNDEERSRWERAMAERRKKGMAILSGYRESLGGTYASMQDCPFCDGANDALEERF